MSHIVLQISQLVIAVLGGILVAWYWNQQKHALERYRHLDEAYLKLLDSYRQAAVYGDRDKTAVYAASWTGEDRHGYHYFAMTVHTVMESIHDMFPRGIPDEWIHVFNYHTRLHAAWLRENRDGHRPGYVARVLGVHGPGPEDPSSASVPAATPVTAAPPANTRERLAAPGGQDATCC